MRWDERDRRMKSMHACMKLERSIQIVLAGGRLPALDPSIPCSTCTAVKLAGVLDRWGSSPNPSFIFLQSFVERLRLSSSTLEQTYSFVYNDICCGHAEMIIEDEGDVQDDGGLGL
jgi:hypothetical protein